MSVSISPLRLDGFESLPTHIRQCIFWEVDPVGIPGPESGYVIDSEFEKEAWVSMVMLDWGKCAQVAVESTTGRTIGTAFYAPPGRVPRARLFPTSPVSADAVLLTSVRVDAGFEGTAESLVAAVVADLVERGVRAVESFGIVRSAGDEPDDLAPAKPGLSDPSSTLCPGCMTDAHFLTDVGFELVAPHHRFPRFRLELDEGLGWKSAVESALAGLVVMATIDATGRERTAVPVG
ncbi:MAG: hypothetical protein NTW76_09195 [Corynebacteriales bacterium]|nr:hypothetical protein [Mycobacteriales bacterium]